MVSESFINYLELLDNAEKCKALKLILKKYSIAKLKRQEAWQNSA